MVGRIQQKAAQKAAEYMTNHAETSQAHGTVNSDLALKRAAILIFPASAQADAAFDEKLNTSKQAGGAYLIGKRCFDFLFSFAASVILLVPLLILAFLVVLKDFGNPFYVQKRVGQHGRPLAVVKLRSMTRGADQLEKMLTPEQLAQYRREYKLSDDPRLIGYHHPGDSRKCFGGLIRRMSIDEIPQIIWNICIRGDMSLVGPRPILKEELEENYTKEEQQLLLSVKPGLTGYWQAFARNQATYAAGERQRMELFYVRHQSLWLDIKILSATVGAVLTQRGSE